MAASVNFSLSLSLLYGMDADGEVSFLLFRHRLLQCALFNYTESLIDALVLYLTGASEEIFLTDFAPTPFRIIDSRRA